MEGGIKASGDLARAGEGDGEVFWGRESLGCGLGLIFATGGWRVDIIVADSERRVVVVERVNGVEKDVGRGDV